MGLQLIIGGSGSGKTLMMYNELIKKSMEEQRHFYVVVPEQFTMETQKMIVNLSGERRGSTKIDIVSFNRLAKRIFDEAGLNKISVLDDTGKCLLLRKIIEENKKDFTVFGSKSGMSGFVEEMKSMISELYQYGVGEEKLQEILSMAGKRPLLQAKLQDIALIRSKLREYMQDNYIMNEEILERVSTLIENSQIMKDSIVSFDEYTGFSPVQYEVIRKLLKASKDVYITITLRDADKIDYAEINDLDVFGISRKTINKLKTIAREENVPIYSDIILNENKRQDGRNTLIHLEKNIFKPSYTRIKSDEDIEIHVCDNPVMESEYVAVKIEELIRQGYRYKDMAVITTDIESYDRFMRETFNKYDIPCFIDNKKSVTANPMVETIRAALEIISDNFSYESVFRYLRYGMTALKRDEIDALENYTIKNGIRGRKKWNTPFLTTDSLDVVECEEEEYRQKFLQNIMPLYETFKSKRKIPVKQGIEALVRLIDELKIKEKTDLITTHFFDSGNPVKGNEYAQTYELVMNVFERSSLLIGEELVNAKELSDILDSGFAELKVFSVPPTLDRVVVGDLVRTRLNNIKVLFLVGANDGLIPKADNGNSVLNRHEREFLYESGVELSPTIKENAYIQKFYLYLMMTKMSEKLFISFKKSDSNGSSMRPSYIVNVVNNMFEGIKVYDESLQREGSLPRKITNLKTAKSYVLENANDFISGKLNEEEQKVFSQVYIFIKNRGLNPDELIKRAINREPVGRLNQAVSKVLYGKELKNSVSRLETFAGCAYRHFIEYGLSLAERKDYEVYNNDIGSVYHKTLELFFKEVRDKEIDIRKMDDSLREEIIKKNITEILKDDKSKIFSDTGRNKYILEKIQRVSSKTVKILSNQISAGSFVPSEFEIRFSAERGYSNMIYSYDEDRQMKLSGVIDRIDYYDDGDNVYVKIIDYKSGNKQFEINDVYNGMQLQLSVYMDAALEHAKRKFKGKNIIPAGMFFYNINEPVLDGDKIKLTADLEKNREIISTEETKTQRVNGMVTDNMDVLRAFDENIDDLTELGGESMYVPIKFNKGGKFAAKSGQVTGEQMDCVLKYVQNKVYEFGKQIIDGDIEVNPKMINGSSPCDYCEYTGICGVDPAKNIKEIKKENQKTILNKMREEMDGHAEMDR